MKKTDKQMLVIFGASGDLTARKLIPALFDLYRGGYLPENFAILGTSRSVLSDEEYRKRVVMESPYLSKFVEKGESDTLQKFAEMVYYQALGKDYLEPYTELKERIDQLDESLGTGSNFIFYFSIPPSIYQAVAKNLSEAGLADDYGTSGTNENPRHVESRIAGTNNQDVGPRRQVRRR